ncbi:hypothetical protein CBL_01646 [Carabus blaptoides fortunei]
MGLHIIPKFFHRRRRDVAQRQHVARSFLYIYTPGTIGYGVSGADNRTVTEIPESRWGSKVVAPHRLCVAATSSDAWGVCPCPTLTCDEPNKAPLIPATGQRIHRRRNVVVSQTHSIYANSDVPHDTIRQKIPSNFNLHFYYIVDIAIM